MIQVRTISSDLQYSGRTKLSNIDELDAGGIRHVIQHYMEI